MLKVLIDYSGSLVEILEGPPISSRAQLCHARYTLQGMLDLYFGYLIWRTDFLENTLMLERLKAEEEGDGRGWDGWMASSIQWTWVWVSSRRWSTRVLQSMELQRVGHDWVIEHQCSVWLTKFKNQPQKEKLNKYYGLNMCSLKTQVLISNPQCDGM